MGNRFWEFYLIRYLLGTIFGIVILFYLVINYNESMTKAFFNNLKPDITLTDNETVKGELSSFLFESTYSFKKEDFNVIFKNIGGDFSKTSNEENIVFKQSGLTVLTAIILTVGGFLYMYLSSMLILVLHGIRLYIYILFDSHYFQKLLTNAKQSLLQRNFKSLKFIIYMLIFVFTVSFATFVSTENNHHAISIVVILFWVCVMILTYPNVKTFYDNLASYRAEISKSNYIIKLRKFVNIELSRGGTSSSPKSEYIESYKHLREHGNAFGIIICEILFAMWWIWWDFSFWAIFYWCLLGFSSWLLGTYLEVKAVNVENINI
ncbi:hypothetical protein [Paenibacillus sp. M2]|uniref:hypothetical protein n=1 Tax=Paenibacillus sp. M2 TaxID=3341793 RepID=UPI0039898D52